MSLSENIFSFFKAGIINLLNKGLASMSCCITDSEIITSHCFNFLSTAPATPVKIKKSIFLSLKTLDTSLVVALAELTFPQPLQAVEI